MFMPMHRQTDNTMYKWEIYMIDAGLAISVKFSRSNIGELAVGISIPFHSVVFEGAIPSFSTCYSDSTTGV